MWLTSKRCIFLLFLLILVIGFVNPQCVSQGVCHKTGEMSLPCATPKDTTLPPIVHQFGQQYYADLNQYCPHLMTGNKSSLCCDGAQAKALIKQIKQAEGILGRCPACYDNFLKLWCEFTCSPKQSDFVKVLKTETTNTTDSVEVYATNLEYRLSRVFAEGLYASCENVLFAGESVLRVMCDKIPCFLDDWLNYLGTSNRKLNIPLNITFELTDKNSTLQAEKGFMDTSFTLCSQSVRPGYGKCPMMECSKERFAQLVNLTTSEVDTKVCYIHGMVTCSTMFVILSFLASLAMLLCVGFVYASYNEENQRVRRIGESGRIKKTGAWIDDFFRRTSKEIGEMAGRNAKTFFLIGCTVLLFCLPGMIYHEESRDLLDMWSSPQSRARQEEHLFNTYFGRPQRYNQVMLLTTNSSETRENTLLPGSAFKREVLEEMFDILDAIKKINATDSEGRTITLDDVCYRPMGPGYDCLIMSPTNYFQGDKTLLDFKDSDTSSGEDEDLFDYYAVESAPSYEKHIKECIDNPMLLKSSIGLSCFGTYGGPSYPNLIFGKTKTQEDFYSARALIMTILVSQRNDVEIERAEFWEKKYLEHFQEKPYNITRTTTTSYMAERSILDQIEKDAKEEVLTIVIALLFLLGYMVFSLGRYYVCENRLITIMVHSRIGLGISSVIITTFSSFCSWGVLSMMGIHPVKSALAVQFFLVTLLGVSRTFMVVKYYAMIRVTHPYMGPEKLPEIVGMVTTWTMPVVISSSVSAAFCFFVGSFTLLPAIKSFCRYSGLAIMIDALLHCTLFMALFVWDTKRELKGRVEFFLNYKIQDLQAAHLIGRQSTTDTYLTHMFKTGVAPFLMKRSVLIVTGVVFIVSFIVAVILSSFVTVGFDQRMVFTKNSYISSHFSNLENHVSAGPPIWFVVNGELDWHEPKVQNRFCTFPGCDDVTFGSILSYASTQSRETMLSGEVYNWIDNFLQWMDRRSPCCKVYVNDPNSFCSTNNNASLTDACRSCMDYDVVANSFERNSVEWMRPSKEFFYRFLKHFLEDTPNRVCVFGGRASFKDAIYFTSRGRIQASHFMTFNTKLELSNSTAFVDAIKKARTLATILEKNINTTAKVFAYGKIFPFYEQYTTILEVLTSQLAVTVVGTFSIICLSLGIDVKGAACAVICQTSNYFHIMAQMYLFNIQVNAISATVLLMSSAILLEFAVNILKGYASSERNEAVQRAQETISSVAPIIIAGPVFTMTGSTLFLSGAHLQIINVYFCQLVLIVIICSAFHALIFLPCVLSFGGSTRNRNRVNMEDRDNAGDSPALAIFDNPEGGTHHESDGKDSPSLDSIHLLDPLLSPINDPLDAEESDYHDEERKRLSEARILRRASSLSSSTRLFEERKAPKAVCEIEHDE